MFSQSFRKLNKRKRSILIVLILLLTLLLLYTFQVSIKLTIRDLLYITRPIWDNPPVHATTDDRQLLAHFYGPQIPMEKLCKLHGWKSREKFPRVIDAFIFSIELDFLEIRLKELWDVVDTFLIVEADKTFTGKPKRLHFNESKDRFHWAKGKLSHYILKGLSSNPEKMFDNEATTRGTLNSFISFLSLDDGDLVIVGDVDEIPYSHTIKLLKSCEGWLSTPGLHLQMQNYLYSFEFRLLTKQWRAHVSAYGKGFRYHHGRLEEEGSSSKSIQLLADAGWHCSFCFPHISDFIFKMTSYSHSDRVTKPELLDPRNIQQRICEGTDIYDMLPEAFTFRDLIAQWGKLEKTASTIGIPDYILQNPGRFSYLLPGGCVRKDGP